MGTTCKYEKFHFRKEWFDFAETLDRAIQGAFYWAIMEYGIDGTRNVKLSGESLDYFNTDIVPDIDKQHSKMKARW